MDRDDGVPFGFLHLRQGLVAQDAGVVDEDVGLAESVESALQDALAAGDGGDVVVVRHGGAAGRSNLLDDGICHVLAGPRAVSTTPEIVDDHGGAGARQRERMLAADAAACTRHDRDLSVQQTHRSVLLQDSNDSGH